MTDKRVKLIDSRCDKYALSQLRCYIRWVFKSRARWARFMRDPRKSYLELENLLRWKHLQRHLSAALQWREDEDEAVAVVFGDRVFRG